jgi:hypothetical protein
MTCLHTSNNKEPGQAEKTGLSGNNERVTMYRTKLEHRAASPLSDPSTAFQRLLNAKPEPYYSFGTLEKQTFDVKRNFECGGQASSRTAR